MQSQGSGLASLPTELLNKIAGPLSTNDFNALRSTCKTIENKLFHYWANCFFRKRQFMIDEFSLQTLVDISQHHTLSKVMTYLFIGLDEFEAITTAVNQHEALEYGQWRAATASQKNLLQTGHAIDLLTTALTNLPNLRGIGIRDFNSPTRYRDAVGQQVSEWRSYGSSSYRQWKHEDSLWCDNRSKEFIGLVFKAILTALDRCSPELVSLVVAVRNRPRALMDDTFAFSPVLGAGLTKTLHSLTKLHLDLVVCQDQRQDCPFLRSIVSDFCDPLTAYTRNFLAHTKNVQWLRLNFSQIHWMPSSTTTKFLNWLSLEPGCDPYPKHLEWNEMNPAPIALPLRHLDLGGIIVQPNVLHKVLAKFPHLVSFCLKDSILRVEDLSSHTWLNNEGAYEDGDCVLARFIRGLSISAPSLKRLALSHLKQDYKDRKGPFDGKTPIVFSPRNIKRPSCLVTGIDKDKAKLERLADITWNQAQFHTLLATKNDNNNDNANNSKDGESDQDEDSESQVDDASGWNK